MTGETISVRMYRKILGDCFLLTHCYGRKTFRALIDCGALQRIGSGKPETQTALEQLPAIIDDLHQETGGTLDLVIATHEHYDHLSGFILENERFGRFAIKSVWMAWTEDPRDELATAIREKRSKGLAALAALAAENPNPAFAAALGAPDAEDRVKVIRDLLQFYGEVDDWVPPTGAMQLDKKAAPRQPKDPPRSCADVFAWLRKKAGAENVRYLSPGEQVRFGIDDRLVANVLGPPRAKDRLKHMDPKADREVYLTADDAVRALSRTLGVQVDPPKEGDRTLEAALPFSARFQRSIAKVEGPAKEANDAAAAADDAARVATDAKRRAEDVTGEAREAARAEAAAALAQRERRAAEARTAAAASDMPAMRYAHASCSDRRIDGEWLGSAEALALKIDGDVNNTSLALAIETGSGDVLLFPADAQVGNWLSWHDQVYPSKPAAPEPQTKTAAHLLERTILYKVGHHGSHNATAQDKGLELMTSPALVAMIPVVDAVAGEQKTRHNPEGWAMPYDKLYDRLKERTRQRIVKGDGDPASETAAFAGSRFSLSYDPANAAPLWVELTCPIAG